MAFFHGDDWFYKKFKKTRCFIVPHSHVMQQAALVILLVVESWISCNLAELCHASKEKDFALQRWNDNDKNLSAVVFLYGFIESLPKCIYDCFS